MGLQVGRAKFIFCILPLWWGLLISELQGFEQDEHFGGTRTRNRGMTKDDVRLVMPAAVELGSDLQIDCLFNSSYVPIIYSVKWYKGTREFFRYIPHEKPAKKIIDWEGVTVDEKRSDISRVYLTNVPLQLTGSIECELTPEPVDIKVVKKTQNLTVIVQAEKGPTLESSVSPLNKYVQPGDSLHLTCTSGPSKPAANLTFYINGVAYLDRSFRQFPPDVADVSSDNKNYGMESRKAVINVTLNETLFLHYKIKIKCAAVIYNYIKFSQELEWQLPIPSRPAASGYGNRNSASTNSAISNFGKLVWSITTSPFWILLFLSTSASMSTSTWSTPWTTPNKGHPFRS